MPKPVSNIDAVNRLGHLFRLGKGLPCPGTDLLIVFAEARPTDFSFLKAADIRGLCKPAFVGIAEWEAFSRHYAACELWNA